MQVKATPLNPNPVTGDFEASSNVSYPQLAEGKLRIRVAFLPMNEQQHELVAKMLSVSEATIVQVSADPLLKIEREVHPSLPPKVHMMGSPLWMDIEIGPRALPAGDSLDASSGVEASSAGTDAPAASQLPATPSGGPKALPAATSSKSKSSRSRKKNGNAPANQAANQAASDTADDTAEGDAADPKKDETVN